MGGKIRSALRLCAALACAAALAAAQGEADVVRIYLAEDALRGETARQLLALLEGEMPQVQWQMIGEGEAGSLRELVMAGSPPDLAICAPEEARPWAKEGLLAPLHARVPGQARMQRQALDLCVLEEGLFMAPLIARHRQMAVNSASFTAVQMDDLLSRRAYPVWYPAQFQQVIEEFAFSEQLALEIWPPEPETSAALEAMTQAIYGGELLDEEGEACLAAQEEMVLGVRWLRDLAACGLIGMAKSRDDALEHFLSGETAIFIDWTEMEALRQEARLHQSGMDVVSVPYPASSGLPVRSFELTGLCVFRGGAGEKPALDAAEFICSDERAQALLGSRGIWQDDSVWLQSLGSAQRGATLRALFARALGDVLAQKRSPDAAMALVSAAMEAARQAEGE
ncbi:MAG: extracellular solute-binding protein [Clostridia bacterium]|nr:extracellular solute-binding protein [Clostridia bacterium]